MILFVKINRFISKCSVMDLAAKSVGEDFSEYLILEWNLEVVDLKV